jgi:hypothetical protein
LILGTGGCVRPAVPRPGCGVAGRGARLRPAFRLPQMREPVWGSSVLEGGPQGTPGGEPAGCPVTALYPLWVPVASGRPARTAPADDHLVVPELFAVTWQLGVAGWHVEDTRRGPLSARLPSVQSGRRQMYNCRLGRGPGARAGTCASGRRHQAAVTGACPRVRRLPRLSSGPRDSTEGRLELNCWDGPGLVPLIRSTALCRSARCGLRWPCLSRR